MFHSIKHRSISRKISLFIPAFSASEREEYTIPEDDYQEIYGRSEAAGKRVLGETLQVFENEGIEVEGKLEMDIDPAQFATDAAEKEEYDLVIAGSQGRHSKLSLLLIGSVTEKIVSNASCDVLIVR